MKKILGGIAILLLMIVLLYLMVRDYYVLHEEVQQASVQIVTLLKMTLWAFMFGILMEWRGLWNLVRGRFHLNWLLLIPTILLSVVVFIPRIYWIDWYQVSQNFYPNVFLLPDIHMILTVFAGTMLVRSFSTRY
ncbi:hypothetical protein [Thalassobacillus hwangdonensis]|uniref:Uncharacterized protein n=1 Tax=Thalassobacillus hwangdonensis TaxID=546108 RepID=A0ABW3L4A9_9BACI